MPEWKLPIGVCISFQDEKRKPRTLRRTECSRKDERVSRVPEGELVQLAAHLHGAILDCEAALRNALEELERRGAGLDLDALELHAEQVRRTGRVFRADGLTPPRPESSRA